MRPRVTKNPGEVITWKPSLITCRYDLENGQVLFVRLTRNRNTRGKWTGDESIFYVYTVLAIVAKDRKEAKRILQEKNPESMKRQTGDGGLEALAVASRYIRAFCKFIKYRMELQIRWTDDKRRKAYRYLLRYEGFASLKDSNGADACIAYRNPHYYEWLDKEKGDKEDGGTI